MTKQPILTRASLTSLPQIDVESFAFPTQESPTIEKRLPRKSPMRYTRRARENRKNATGKLQRERLLPRATPKRITRNQSAGWQPKAPNVSMNDWQVIVAISLFNDGCKERLDRLIHVETCS